MVDIACDQILLRHLIPVAEQQYVAQEVASHCSLLSPTNPVFKEVAVMQPHLI